jgi:hypothetical protein
MSHNGYRNYETWIVKVWIDNDQGQHDYWIEVARHLDQTTEPSKFLTAQQEAERRLEEALKAAHWDGFERAESVMLTGVFMDLLKSSLEEVDWKELSETIMEEAHS